MLAKARKGGEEPLISVILPTYNYSSVLPFAMRSVLAQTEPRFELLVIGDGCTDDTEEVVASFDDPRVRWHNLPRNSGQKAGPMNAGLELARGAYVAYLGQDDLWLPGHLQVLLAALTRERADLAFSVIVQVMPDGSVHVVGMSPSDRYEVDQTVNFICLMHRRELASDLGGWPEYDRVSTESHHAFLERAHAAGKQMLSVNELTGIKFSSGRQDLYLERPTEVQERYSRWMAEDPEFRHRLLMQVLKRAAAMPEVRAKFVFSSPKPGFEGREPGELVALRRELKGLPATPDAAELGPLDLAELRKLNHTHDITPVASRQNLLHLAELQPDGLHLGRRWSVRDVDQWGAVTRRLYRTAELVVTRPTPGPHALRVTLRYQHPDPARTAAVRFTGPDGATLDVPVDGQEKSFAVPLALQADVTAVVGLELIATGAEPPGFVIASAIDWLEPGTAVPSGRYAVLALKWLVLETPG